MQWEAVVATNDRPASPRPSPSRPPRRGGWLATALAFIAAAGCHGPEGEEPDLQSAELIGNNISGNNISGNNISGNNISGNNISGNNISGNNISGNNLSAGNATWSNLDGLKVRNPGSSSGRDLLYSGRDRLPAADRCVVMGIGSTTFAQFLGQQSPTTTLQVAIGKLPWGFASRANGPIESSAWEVIAQGDRTGCSFVLSTPRETSWSGVAGFMKAVFRWNAPISQTMRISAIQASAGFDASVGPDVVEYTGMMDAASRWRTGQIDERHFVAGELAFIAATTNNRSVMVDFASWVTGVGGTGLILGNVDSEKPPTYAESVYYAYDKGDGTIGLAVGPASGKIDGAGYSERLASSYESLDAAYQLYQAGMFPKPIPTRCGGALFLNARYGEVVPAGKCDSSLSWTVGPASNHRTWVSVPGTTAPMNEYMLLPASSAPLQRNGKIVLSETYVHMWDVSYDYGARRGPGKRVAPTPSVDSALDRSLRAELPQAVPGFY
jgi:hypothetical protein